MTAQILDISPDEYHARSGLSSTIAKTLIARSPLHAKAEYRRRAATKEMDVGNVVHRLVLGKGRDFEALDFGDYKTNAAKTARDAARKAGKTPVLVEAFARANTTAEAIRAGLADRGIVLDGESEVAIEWNEESAHGPVQCRGMLDHVWLTRGVIVDLKVTHDAAPTSVERTSENLGYGIQSAAYTRALTAFDPSLAGRVDFLFVFAEPEEPYAINVCRPDGMFRELGERRWLRAVSTWAECLATDTWPAYGATNNLSCPAWALAREGYTTEER